MFEHHSNFHLDGQFNSKHSQARNAGDDCRGLDRLRQSCTKLSSESSGSGAACSQPRTNTWLWAIPTGGHHPRLKKTYE
jgi:hypothetical protein